MLGTPLGTKNVPQHAKATGTQGPQREEEALG